MRARTCVLVVSLLIMVLTGAKPMTENQSRLAEAAALLAQFRDKRDAEPYLLERSADALSAVDLDGESEATRAPTERLVLQAWLQLLHQIDDAKAIGFDPTRVPPRHVSPPQEDGRVLLPGVAPEQIRDPSLRETYRQALETHRRDQIDFNRQINLKKTDDYVTPFVEDFLRGYARGRPEQQVKEEIGNRVSFARTLALLKAISPSP
ncbi:hypothetical protein [Lysobacter enzymogenes]|nr:hypothetical protein [Lysobacter enzymogenes]